MKKRILLIISILFLVISLSNSIFAQHELIINGEFTNGYNSFTTQYTHKPTGNVSNGEFCIDNNCQGHNNLGLGWPSVPGVSGKYMIVNGEGWDGAQNKVVWKQTVNVTSQTTYDFSCKLVNLSRSAVWPLTANPSIIRIKINGSTGNYDDVTLNVSNHNWQSVNRIWNSGNLSGQIDIEIYDVYTDDPDHGDDFGLDQISFVPRVWYDVNAQDDYVNDVLCLNAYVDVNVLQNDGVLPNTNDAQVQVLTNPAPHGTAQVLSNKKIRYTFTDANYNGEVQFDYRVTNHGVVSEATVHINTARPPTITNINLSSPIDICEGESLTLPAPTVTENGTSIISQGWQVLDNGSWQPVNPNTNTIPSVTIGQTKVRYYATNQCDTEYYEVNLNVHEEEEITLPAVEECDSYTWHGTTYTQSGNYDYTTTTEWGCTRLEHLPLTIHYSDTLSIPVSACESYTWYGQTYSQSGTYDHLTTNSFGCTRLEQLELTLSEEFRQVDILTECDAYFWPRKNQWYYQDVLDSVPVPGPPGGCDSTFVLDLTIHYGDTIDVDPVTACDSYEWHGETYTTSGIKTYLTTNEFGCDRLERLDLTINYSENIELPAVTACDVFSWHGQDYTQSGLAVFDTVNQNNCPLQYTLPLTILHSDTLDWEPVTECDSYIWFGQTITESGQYERWTTNPDNCDRLERIYVTINYSTIDTLDPVTACDSYEWHGQEYTQTGYYTFEEEGPTGCPRTEVLLLTINHSSEKELDVTACESYEWYDSTYYEPGTYYHVLPNSQGCDSLLILHLQIGETFEFEESATGCESYEWHGQTYFESGYYEYPVDNPEGCDSLFILHLTIASNYEEEIEAESCYSYTWIDEVYDESGDYPRHFTAITGCDSLVVLHLTIKEAILHEFEQQTCQPYEWNGITYYEDGYYEQTFDASNGCDSIATMHLVFSDALTSEFDRTACDFITWEEHLCDHEGDYSHTYQSIQGCDSIVTMHFSLTDAFINEFDTLACEPFQWFEYDCQQDGTISHNFITTMGCDSTVIKHVTLNHPESSTQFIAACDSYVYNGVVYDEPGVFFIDTDTLFNQSGCDSIVFHIRLEIKDSEQIGLISGLSNVYVASNLINGIYRYEVDPEEVQGSIEWTLSDPDWQIVEAQENYCLVLVSTPVTATLTAHFRTPECGVIDRDFVINAGFFGVEDQSLDVKVFPNPTQGTVTIEAEGIESLRLCDMLGQVLETHDSGRADHVTLYLNAYQPAVYLLEIKTINGTVKKRLMLCR